MLCLVFYLWNSIWVVRISIEKFNKNVFITHLIGVCCRIRSFSNAIEIMGFFIFFLSLFTV